MEIINRHRKLPSADEDEFIHFNFHNENCTILMTSLINMWTSTENGKKSPFTNNKI